MQIEITDALPQTIFFSVLFLGLILLSLKKVKPFSSLTKEHTQELKGIAILTIIFGHIGWLLAKDHQFLFPLSALSGVGVNLFLFLSGFGLTLSEKKKQLKP